ncbi:hypothetical protein [Tunturibacter empetritectus]|uniref:Transmembrane protein n=1 Tax=Tunturiibacter lichenicola TaxID=2051959 RepID=A0A7W8JDC1_9BACT|nr:hypothetical protein [Edaphobacter lichenicola]MBB5345779.1 hypothetical protein [Edaphobacter lichenicola]
MQQETSRRFELRSTTAYQIFLKVWFPLFAAITVIGLIVPLNPETPRGGIDRSWVMSMNEAVADHMRIGHDVIFTFGPYAAMYSQVYHPLVDHLILLTSLIFALCYLGALLYMAGNENRTIAILFLVFLGWFAQSRDALFFSYPLLLALSAAKFCGHQEKQPQSNFRRLASVAALCIPLGILPLVKGNMIVLCAMMVLLIASYLLYQRYVMLAVVVVVVPILSLLLFWTMAGQPFNGLADYGSSSVQILSGYTEAMGLQGEFRGILGYLPNVEIAAYLVAAAAVLWNLSRSMVVTGVSKLFLGVCFTLFFFVGFKSGFVRHDMHAPIAASCLVFASILTGFLGWDRRVRVTLVLCALVLAGITIRYNPQVLNLAKAIIPNYKQKTKAPVGDLPISRHDVTEEKKSISTLAGDAVLGVYGHLWNGLRIRLFENDELSNAYLEGLAKIREEYPVPKLAGTVDIYPTDDAYILASGDTWNPRPVIQSYTAWTPKLALINEQHLRTEKAPNYLLFGFVPMEDNHLPSLNDGVSWAAFLDNYTVSRVDEQFAYLHKKDVVQDRSDFNILQTGVYKTGERIVMSGSGKPIFAEIDLEPTPFGRLIGIVFKPTQVRILLKLSDGTRRDYRVLPTMMRTGFCVSPLVEDTRGFAQFVDGDEHSLNGAVVKEMTIVPYHPGWMVWKDHYKLTLKEYHGGAWLSRSAAPL